MDITDTLAAKSDQLNAIDLIGGPITVTVTDARKVGGDQPVSIWTAELGEGRPYKPCLSMRRVIARVWGPDSSAYIGRRMTLFNDPSVKWAGAPVGGLRISHMSHIDKPVSISLPESKGKQKPHRVEPLPDLPATKSPADKIIAAFATMNVTVEQLEKRLGLPRDGWDATDLEALAALGKSIKAGDTTVAAEFATPEPVQAALDGTGE